MKRRLSIVSLVLLMVVMLCGCAGKSDNTGKGNPNSDTWVNAKFNEAFLCTELRDRAYLVVNITIINNMEDETSSSGFEEPTCTIDSKELPVCYLDFENEYYISNVDKEIEAYGTGERQYCFDVTDVDIANATAVINMDGWVQHSDSENKEILSEEIKLSEIPDYTNPEKVDDTIETDIDSSLIPKNEGSTEAKEEGPIFEYKEKVSFYAVEKFFKGDMVYHLAECKNISDGKAEAPYNIKAYQGETELDSMYMNFSYVMQVEPGETRGVVRGFKLANKTDDVRIEAYYGKHGEVKLYEQTFTMDELMGNATSEIKAIDSEKGYEDLFSKGTTVVEYDVNAAAAGDADNKYSLVEK